MQNTESLWFPDADFVKTITSETVPLLFSDYKYGDISPDFNYLGGSEGRDKLESALAQPSQGFGGEYRHPSISDKAAALIWFITKDHPFVDGNKRAALTTAFFFLAFNKFVLLVNQSEAVEMCRQVAAGEQGIDVPYISDWINERIIGFDEIGPGNAEPNEKFVKYVGSASNDEIGAFRLFCGTIAEGIRQALDEKDASDQDPPFLS